MAAVTESLGGQTVEAQAEALSAMSPDQRAQSFSTMVSPERERRWEELSPGQRKETMEALVLASRVSIVEALGLESTRAASSTLAEMEVESRLDTLAAMNPLRRKAALAVLPEQQRIEASVALSIEALVAMGRVERSEALLEEALDPAVRLGLLIALSHRQRRECFAMMSGAQRQKLQQGLGPQEATCLLEMMTATHQAEVVARMGSSGLASFVVIFDGMGPPNQRRLLAAMEQGPRHGLLEALGPGAKDAAMTLLSVQNRHAAAFQSMVAWSQLEMQELGGLLEDGEVLAAIEGDAEKAALLASLPPEERGTLLATLPLEERSRILGQMPIPRDEKAYTIAVLVASLPLQEKEPALLSLSLEARIEALRMMSPEDAAASLLCIKEPHRLSTLKEMQPEDRVPPLEAMSEADRNATLDCFHVEDRVKHRIAKLNARERALRETEAAQRGAG